MVQVVKKISEKRTKSRTEVRVQIAGRDMKLSNLEKVLYPSGFTKGQVIDYYVKMSDIILPHLKGRPLTLKRYPEGTEEGFFYEKNCPRFKPDWIRTMPVDREDKPGEIVNYCSVDGVAGLVWVVNLASLELHTLLSKYPDVLKPTMMAFDFDPGEGMNVLDCCRVAKMLKAIFDRFGLQSFPKTSGGKGFHLYVPLNTPVHFDETKAYANTLAVFLERQNPDLVVSNMSKALRRKKVFVDWSQNDDHKTTVLVYSLRARREPAVSTPVTWEEVDRALAKKDPELLHFTAPDVLKRTAKSGDLFAPVLTLKQKLPKKLPPSG